MTCSYAICEKGYRETFCYTRIICCVKLELMVRERGENLELRSAGLWIARRQPL
jgi:hypothetical protein